MLFGMTAASPQSPGAILAEIRAEMARQGLTGTQLATLTGLSQPTISRSLSALREVTLPELLVICDALGLTLAALAARAEQVAA